MLCGFFSFYLVVSLWGATDCFEEHYCKGATQLDDYDTIPVMDLRR